MAIAPPTYSTFFTCLHDEDRQVASCLPAYSVFRAIDSRDVTRKPTERPRVHDFVVIWDDDHDARIIAVIEEMLMAGILPGVQFISEHKGTLSIILASPTYWANDPEEFKAQVSKLSAAAGDFWVVEVGMIDTTAGNMKIQHQCDFLEILGNSDAEIAFFFLIAAAWQLGTKVYPSIDIPPPPPPALSGIFRRDRYLMSPSPNRQSLSAFQPPFPPPPPLPR
jgi:hypothetical protein